MRAFTRLIERLEGPDAVAGKVAALEAYLCDTPAADAAQALWFLGGGRVRRAVARERLRTWAAAASGLPGWLVDDCERHVGDAAEALALLVPPGPSSAGLPLSVLVETRLTALTGATLERQYELVRLTWSELETAQRVIWHRLLLAGGLGPGVSRTLVSQALAGVARVDPAVMTYRLARPWRPQASDLTRLLAPAEADEQRVCPYPFLGPAPLDGPPAELGDPADWQVGWLWPGTRVQLIRRRGEALLWSAEGEWLGPAFPEVMQAARRLPDGTVLDGMLLAWRSGDRGPLPESEWKRRLKCRRPSSALRARLPAVFVAGDLLELGGIDWRPQEFATRWAAVERVIAEATRQTGDQAGAAFTPRQGELFAAAPVTRLPETHALRVAPRLEAGTWEAVASWRGAARSAGAAGVVLRRLAPADDRVTVTRPWLQWRAPALACTAVLIAVRSGRETPGATLAGLTFAVWRGTDLVPVATALADLPADEAGWLADFVRTETTGRFGPVRSVRPVLVFELAFDGVARSARRRAGLILSAPRVCRWCRDRPPGEADTIETLEAMAAAMAP